MDRRLGGPQSQSGRGGEENNSEPLPGLELPTIQPVAQGYATELSRLHPSPQHFVMKHPLSNGKGHVVPVLLFN
jgi:hypothetical protein